MIPIQKQHIRFCKQATTSSHHKSFYVERDAVNMGRIAMNMLLDHIKNPKGSMLTRREYIIPANLVLKGSEYRKL